MSGKDLVLFGMNGVLVDSDRGVNGGLEALRKAPNSPRRVQEGSFYQLWELELKEADRRFLEGEVTFVESRRALVRAFWGPVTDATSDALYRRYAEGYLQSLSVAHDVPGLLFCLQGVVNFGVLARGDGQSERQQLERLGIEDIFGVVEVLSIPAWRNDARFRAKISRLGVARERIVYVGSDLMRDVLPLHRLGFRAVWLNRGAGRGTAEIPTIKSLDELPRYILPDQSRSSGAAPL